MKPRVNLAIGAVSIIVAAVILTVVLKSCTRDDYSGRVAEDEANPNRHLASCEAERETGICNPSAKRTKGDFDWDAFMAMVRENQVDASYQNVRSDAGASYSAFSYSSAEGNTSSQEGSATAIVRIIGGGSTSSPRSSARSRPSGRGSTGDGSSGFGGTWGDGGFGAGFGDGGFDGWRAVGDDEGGQRGGGSDNGDADGGLEGERGPLPSGKCLRSRSLLAQFDQDDITSGEHGWTFPVLIDGDCPVSAAILKGPESGEGFGGPINDF
ncbi:hypothetical protein HYW84_03470 [Candidatus Peregrinibacteria bacterium]|nr:hypothetical protein [Candidatus Peregrinibacteria bacterium]